MKKLLLASLLTSVLVSPLSMAANYIIDYKGAHASVNFKIKHLGYSWLTGRFDKFDGHFSYDASNVAASKITMNVDVTSFNSNHKNRDVHIKSNDYLSANKYSSAQFVSSSVTDLGNDKLLIKGPLTLHGVTRDIEIDVTKVGEGKDPWGGYRVGFSGTTKIGLADFGIPAKLGPKSTHVTLDIFIEGIRQ